MEIRFRTKREAWEQGYQDGKSAVQHDLNLIKDAEAKAEREKVLDALDIELQEIKSRIESSAMGKPLSERERGRIIGILDARVKLESLRGGA